ncbi:outer membrane protein [Terrihabitans soli]|uniref:Porin n=1 Tax=Terrihabitans soli TaxID=708113 RepID=A0A6S6QP67_9HYPH|nr:porin [Terrihabitans soli]BCJ91266.1 outer membrane protein [Terrihabitans soli]
MNWGIAGRVSGIGVALVAGAANAQELPFAEPDEFVKVCGGHGKGFFYIPGTDTCLRVSGLVRSDQRYENDSRDAEANDFHTDLRGRIQFDARTETDFGTLRSYIEFEGRADTYSGDYDDGAGAFLPRNAYIEFAGFTAGHLNRSLFDYAPYKHMSDLFSDERVNTLAYTAKPADGVQAVIGIEDKYFRANPNDGLDSELDQTWPNAIVTLTLKKDWGEARLGAAVQDNEGDRDIGADGDATGWALQTGLILNLPSEVKGSRLWAEGVYSSGAGSYAGGEDFRVNFVAASIGGRTVRDQRDDGAGNLLNTDVWSAGGGVKWFWTEKWHSNVSAIYSDVDPSADGFAAFDYLFAEINTFWTPVTNLELGLALQYGEASINEAGADAPDTGEHWAIVSRVGRSF